MNQFKLENFEESLSDCQYTWSYSPIINEEEVKFLIIYAKDKGLSFYSKDVDTFKKCKRNLESHAKAAKLAKVDLEGECFFNLVPEHQLVKWFSVRQKALSNLLKQEPKPTDYDILHKAHVLTETISKQKCNFKGENRRVQYNIFGSVTGRLTTKRNSVPVLTMRKEDRKLLVPQNDAFVELDLNAAEIRMLMALSGQNQPREDIHEYLQQKLFDGKGTRSEFKERLFAWLYNPTSKDAAFDNFFSRETFRDFFAPEDEILTTPFGRRLKVEERKAQNYLLQSTTSDQVLENAYKIQKMLQDVKSTIAFTLHDSIILDMSKKDAIMLKKIKKQFEETRWGNFKSSCKIGKNFGNLKEINL